MYSFTLTESAPTQGRGDFYYLPVTVWAGRMASGADEALSAYRVVMGETTEGRKGFVLVFIPSNEAYTEAHQENAPEGIAAHTDADYRFSYEIVASQYSPGRTLGGYKRYLGEDKVIRIDAVANRAAFLSAETNVPAKHFSLRNVKDSVSSFELAVDFHDMDATEDHYVLVEMVPNFAFHCGSDYYRPHGGGNVTETDSNAIYTHIFTDAGGNQQFIRYCKIPVSNAAIDPATGEVTVHVEFQRLPGMPQTADYPSSGMLTYGAMTVDKTASRWDSTDPTSPSFVNRKGADGEYSYDNNTSVIIRNGIGDGRKIPASIRAGRPRERAAACPTSSSGIRTARASLSSARRTTRAIIPTSSSRAPTMPRPKSSSPGSWYRAGRRRMTRVRPLTPGASLLPTIPLPPGRRRRVAERRGHCPTRTTRPSSIPGSPAAPRAWPWSGCLKTPRRMGIPRPGNIAPGTGARPSILPITGPTMQPV